MAMVASGELGDERFEGMQKSTKLHEYVTGFGSETEALRYPGSPTGNTWGRAIEWQKGEQMVNTVMLGKSKRKGKIYAWSTKV